MPKKSLAIDSAAFIGTASAQSDSYITVDHLVNVGILLPKSNKTLSLSIAPQSATSLSPAHHSRHEYVTLSQNFLNSLSSKSYDDVVAYAMIFSFLSDNAIEDICMWCKADIEKLDLMAETNNFEPFSSRFKVHILNQDLKNVRIYDPISKQNLMMPTSLSLALSSACMTPSASANHPSLAAARTIYNLAKKYNYKLEMIAFDPTSATPTPKKAQHHLSTKSPAMPKLDIDHACCPVCCDDAPLFAIYSCGHVGCCIRCALTSVVILKEKRCPVCREKAASVTFVTAKKSSEITKKMNFSEIQKLQKSNNYKFWKTLEMISLPKIYENYFNELFSFRCYFCDQKFSNVVALKKHISEHSKYLCDECINYKATLPCMHQFYSKNELETHKREGFIEELPFNGHVFCEYCHTYHYDQSTFENHLKDKHQKCDICYPVKWFKDIKSYENHIFNDHFVCTQCKASTITINNKETKHMIVFDSKHGLDQHIRDVHGSTHVKKQHTPTPTPTPVPTPPRQALLNHPPRNNQHYIPGARYSVDSVMTSYKSAKKNVLPGNIEELFYRYVMEEIVEQKVALPPNFQETLQEKILPEFFWNSELGLWNIKKTYENVSYSLLDQIYKILEQSMKITITALRQKYENKQAAVKQGTKKGPSIEIIETKSKRRVIGDKPRDTVVQSKPQKEPELPKTGLVLGRLPEDSRKKKQMNFSFTYRKK